MDKQDEQEPEGNANSNSLTQNNKAPTEKKSRNGELVTNKTLSDLLIDKYTFVLGQDNSVYFKINDCGNNYAVKVGSRIGNNIIRDFAKENHDKINNNIIKETIEHLIAHAEKHAERGEVCIRVGKIENGCIIDIGNKEHTHIRVTPHGFELVKQNSELLFRRTPNMLSLPIPISKGDLSKLDKYLNIYPQDMLILKAYLSYTLAHAKEPTTNYLILVLQGDQGSGKSVLNQIIKSLIDPSVSPIQSLPRNEKDLAIAAQHNHALCLDNMRSIKAHTADIFCMTSTGGSSICRQLYSDGEQIFHNLHVALILNGIHPFINQPDLAQRCLRITMKPFQDNKRIPESELTKQFMEDYPEIFTGLLELTSKILKELPNVKPTVSERMIDFCYWLAALEKVHNVPKSVYQLAYSSMLNETQLDTLLDDPLAAAVIEYVEHHDELSGTPTDVFDALSHTVNKRTQYWHLWPRNAIGFSKKLQTLKAGLKSQDIEVITTRGKYRELTIRKIKEGENNGE